MTDRQFDYQVVLEEVDGRWRWEVTMGGGRRSKSGFCGLIQDAESAATQAMGVMMRERRPTPPAEVHPLFESYPIEPPPESSGPRVLRTYSYD